MTYIKLQGLDIDGNEKEYSLNYFKGQIVILYFSLFRDSFYLSDMTYAVFYNVLSFPLFFSNLCVNTQQYSKTGD